MEVGLINLPGEEGEIIFLEWLIQRNEFCKKGQPVCLVARGKDKFQILSKIDGYIQTRCEPNTKVSIGDILYEVTFEKVCEKSILDLVYSRFEEKISKIIEMINIALNEELVHLPLEYFIAYRIWLATSKVGLENGLIKLQQEKIKIAFCGYFSSGKTSLLNKLLDLKDNELLSSSSGEDSGVSNYISYGEREKYFIEYNGSERRKEEVNLELFQQSITKKLSAENKYQYVAKAEMILNNNNVPKNCIWIDTAGLTTENNEENDNRLADALQDADIIVWLSKSDKFLSDHDISKIETISKSKYKSPIFLVDNIHIVGKTWNSWKRQDLFELLSDLIPQGFNPETEITKEEVLNILWPKDNLNSTIQLSDLYKVGNQTFTELLTSRAENKSPEISTLDKTILEREWRNVFVEQHLDNIKKVEFIFGKAKPMTLFETELKEVYDEPSSENSQAILKLEENRNPIYIEVFGFTTHKWVDRMDNNFNFELFKKRLISLDNREESLVFYSRMNRLKAQLTEINVIFENEGKKWETDVVLVKNTELENIYQGIEPILNNSINTCFNKVIEELTTKRDSVIKSFSETFEELIKESNYTIKTWGGMGDSDHNHSWNVRMRNHKNEFLELKRKLGGEELLSENLTISFFNSLKENLALIFNDFFEELNKVFVFSRLDTVEKGKLLNTSIESFLNFEGLDLPKLNSKIEIILYYDEISFLENNPFANVKKEVDSYNVGISVSRAKERINQAYNDRIGFTKKLKIMLCEMDKIAFFQSHFGEIPKNLSKPLMVVKDLNLEVTNLLNEIQPYTLLRP